MLRLLRRKIDLLLGLLLGFLLFKITFFLRTTVSLCSKCNGSNFPPLEATKELYNYDLSDKLFDEVKILCWVMISPENHRTRGVHIKNTWGKRCNKLLFMSSEDDQEIGAIALPMIEKITHLWTKVRKAFQYIYDHDELINNYDWFLKADDDTYMIMENLRHMLYQYRPQTALYFGQRLIKKNTLEGFMQGGAYVLSRKAVQKFVKLYPKHCRQKDGWPEDLFMGLIFYYTIMNFICSLKIIF